MFDWMGVSKSIGGNLIGTSPEFELALYTMAFLSGNLALASMIELPDMTFFIGPNARHPCCFDGLNLTIVCHEIGTRNIGTCYPEI